MFNQFHQKYCMACHILNEFLPRPAPNNQLLACLTRLNDKKTKINTLTYFISDFYSAWK